MDKSLRRTGMMNSALLALSFASSTAQVAMAGSFLAIIGALATFFTINDFFKFYNAKPTEEVKEN